MDLWWSRLVSLVVTVVKCEEGPAEPPGPLGSVSEQNHRLVFLYLDVDLLLSAGT